MNWDDDDNHYEQYEVEQERVNQLRKKIARIWEEIEWEDKEDDTL